MTSKVKAILERFRQDLDYKDLSTGELTELVGQLAHKHCVVNDSLCEMIVTEDDHKCLSVTITAHSSPLVHAFVSGFYSNLACIHTDSRQIVETAEMNDKAQQKAGIKALFERLAVDYSQRYNVKYLLVTARDLPPDIAYIGLTHSAFVNSRSVVDKAINEFLDGILKDIENEKRRASGNPLSGQPGSKWDSRTGGPHNGRAEDATRKGPPNLQDPPSGPDQASALRREAEELSNRPAGTQEGQPRNPAPQAEEREGDQSEEIGGEFGRNPS